MSAVGQLETELAESSKSTSAKPDAEGAAW